MELRTCSRCNAVVDIETTPIRPTKAKFGNAHQQSTRCPTCDTIVAAVLHDEDESADYFLDASQLSGEEAADLASGKTRLKSHKKAVKSAKELRSRDVAPIGPPKK